MMITTRHTRIPAFLIIFLPVILICCSPLVQDQNNAIYDTGRDSAVNGETSLSPAQAYAGEVLAYLLQVVVGSAGPSQNRQAWRTTGNGSNLEFKLISKIMTDSGYRKTDLIVLDANLLGLSEVLYRYDPLFNQFKGRYVFDSVYPSSELIAIRLLILRKLNRGEQVSLSAMRDRESLFQPAAEMPSPADLATMNLSADEFQLLKEVFVSESLYLQYYKHPFIVEALTRIGFYKKDNLTNALSKRASYHQYARSNSFDKTVAQQVNIAILPSLTREFSFGETYRSPYMFGFKPTAAYLRALEILEAEIVTRTADRVRAELQTGFSDPELNEDTWQSLWSRRYLPLIRFHIFDQKPFSIYPENAERIITGICPLADLAVIVLGKNVYRTVDFGAGDDNKPVSGRIYLDIEAISRLMVDEQIDNIARFITERLMQIPIAAAGESVAFTGSP